MLRPLAALAAGVAFVAAPASAEPTTVVCEDVRVRLQYVADVCLTYDLAGSPTVTWDCTLRGEYACGTGPVSVPSTVVCEDVYVRLIHVASVCLSYDLTGPSVTFTCTVARDVECNPDPARRP